MGFELPDLVESVSAHGRGLKTRWSLRSLPSQAVVQVCDSVEMGFILTWPQLRWQRAQRGLTLSSQERSSAQWEHLSSWLLPGSQVLIPCSTALQHCQSRVKPAVREDRLFSQATWKMPGSRLQLHGDFLNLLKTTSPKLRNPNTHTLTADCFQALYFHGGYKYIWQKKPVLTYVYIGIITLVTKQ